MNGNSVSEVGGGNSGTGLRLLVIRRDNIGDLLCTTPLLAGLRRRWPDAWIGVLANRYNAPILAGNPDIDAFFAYEKAKHRAPGKSRLAVWSATAVLLWRLRRMKLDCVLCASPGAQRFARLLAPRHIAEADRSGNEHEVAVAWRLLALASPGSAELPGHELPSQELPGPMVLHADAHRRACLQQQAQRVAGECCVAIHLSARKPRQRWPAERFGALARRLLEGGGADRILMFWAPGDEDDPLHPGDDRKARQLQAHLAGLPVTPMPTHELADLVAGLSLADAVICSDGGAMHIAAALGKPSVCFFGNSSAERWHPWGVPYELLQTPSRDVADIGVDEALAAFERLMQRAG